MMSCRYVIRDRHLLVMQLKLAVQEVRDARASFETWRQKSNRSQLIELSVRLAIGLRRYPPAFRKQ